LLSTKIRLVNWKNFREVSAHLHEKTYILGANATGKSNFLDSFRFLRDICKTQGGGLQKAIADRGGIPKLRCLHARRPPEIVVEVELSEDVHDRIPTWKYLLAFKPEGKGAQRTLITQEKIWAQGRLILDRPNTEDDADPARLTQTHLEQIQANAEFRDIANYFNEITYLHLVPQLLKYNELIGGRRLEGDPFGQDFLEGIARTPSKTRDSRLKRISNALQKAVPQFKQLRFEQDKITGQPHLEALYEHYRPNAGWQREDSFSDGTLRLLGLLWLLLDKNSLLLLEEPELSLNAEIVKQIPSMLQRALRENKKQRQILISTHSEALLSDVSIDGNGVLLLETVKEGTSVRSLSKGELDALRAGFSVAEVVLQKTRPANVEQLGFF
jgi:predicted ATPase